MLALPYKFLLEKYNGDDFHSFFTHFRYHFPFFADMGVVCYNTLVYVRCVILVIKQKNNY